MRMRGRCEWENEQVYWQTRKPGRNNEKVEGRNNIRNLRREMFYNDIKKIKEKGGTTKKIKENSAMQKFEKKRNI